MLAFLVHGDIVIASVKSLSLIIKGNASGQDGGYREIDASSAANQLELVGVEANNWVCDENVGLIDRLGKCGECMKK